MKPMKEPGVAHNGLSDWYGQRLSAVVLLVLLPLPFVLLVAVYTGSLDQQALLVLLDHTLSHVAFTILIAALLVHAYMGLKVIIEDYVHGVGLRVGLIGAMLVLISAFGVGWLAMIWGG